MNVTVAISNMAFWVPTWKMLSTYAKKSSASKSKQSKTNPDGTVSAQIDPEYYDELMAEIERHNRQHDGRNKLTLLALEEEIYGFGRATA